MIPVSIIVNIRNETYFLEKTLPMMADIAQVVLVDGGPKGKSTDHIDSLIQSYSNVTYTRGEDNGYFLNDDGTWNRKAQMEAGLKCATQDIVVYLSADRIILPVEGLKRLADSWNEGPNIWFWTNVDFWVDTKHVKYYEHRHLGFCAPPFAFAPLSDILLDENGNYYVKSKPRYTFVDDLRSYHFGWVRPFSQQIEKHLRHIYNGDLDFMQKFTSNYRSCESWAIKHVLCYKADDGLEFLSDLPEELDIFADMTYMNGWEDYQRLYKERYEEDIFQGVMNSLPKVNE